MKKRFKLFTLSFLALNFYYSRTCDFAEKYKKEKLQLFPCKQCTKTHRYFTIPKALPEKLRIQYYDSAIKIPSIEKILPKACADLCNGTLATSLNFNRAKAVIQSIAEMYKSTCMIMQPNAFETPYQSSTADKLYEILEPYRKNKKGCFVIIDSFDDLNNTSADTFRFMIKRTNFQKYISFIFLTSRPFPKIPKPLNGYLLGGRIAL